MKDSMRVVSFTLDSETIRRLDRLCEEKTKEVGTFTSRSAMIRILINKME